MTKDLAKRIDVARGRKKADLVLKGGSVVNVLSGEIERTDVAVADGKIAGLGAYEGRRTIDVTSKFILPGFIDSHVHIESSMLTPAEFCRAALPHGTTAVVADPHEIANVLGKRGIRYLLSASEGLPFDFYFMLPSCVPASGFETSGSRLAAADLLPFLAHRRVLGLAEMMNYPGVLNKDPAVLRKLAAFSPAPIDGHAPELTGRDLAAYIATGISSDHECTTADEAREKVRLGMTVCIREGSSAKDLEALLPAVTPANAGSFTFATDDFQAHDLQQGSIDLLVRKAVCLGLDPVMAVRMATLNAARHYGLRHKGAVAPGYDADMVVAADLGRFAVEQVFKLGKLVAGAGRCTAGVGSRHHEQLMGTVRTGRVDLEDLALKARTGSARVIELVPDQLETKCSVLPVAERGGFVVSDPERDILKLAVIERHRATGNRGMGLLKGLGLTAGALASTVAHDSHNIIAVGVTDGDMLAAVARVQEMHGGLAVVHRGKVLADLPLPVAGLLSTKPLGRVVRELSKIDAAVRSLGVPIEHPFGALSFLALPVIPELKLTDRGLVDVKQFAFVDLFV